MRKLVTFIAALGLVGGVAVAGASGVSAACNTGTTDGADPNQNVVGLPDGGHVYISPAASYGGVIGPHGYIDASPAAVQGASTDAPLEGRVTTDGHACINGMQLL